MTTTSPRQRLMPSAATASAIRAMVSRVSSKRGLANLADPGQPEAVTPDDFLQLVDDRRNFHVPTVEYMLNGKRVRKPYNPVQRLWSHTTGICLHQAAREVLPPVPAGLREEPPRTEHLVGIDPGALPLVRRRCFEHHEGCRHHVLR